MRDIHLIVIHCSATPPSMNIGAAEIRKWHIEKGWKDIGYHYVIRQDGLIEKGRPDEQIGSHVKNHNSNSLGICLVGGVDSKNKPQTNFTAAQFKSLSNLVRILMSEHPKAVVRGHNEYNAGKACPSFDVQQWLKDRGMV
jgi:N-acetyl-anhydromuramyl-L-alanine amidase AmpD